MSARIVLLSEPTLAERCVNPNALPVLALSQKAASASAAGQRAVAPTQQSKDNRSYCPEAHQVSASPSPRIGQVEVLIIGAPPHDPSASQRR